MTHSDEQESFKAKHHQHKLPKEAFLFVLIWIIRFLKDQENSLTVKIQIKTLFERASWLVVNSLRWTLLATNDWKNWISKDSQDSDFYTKSYPISPKFLLNCPQTFYLLTIPTGSTSIIFDSLAKVEKKTFLIMQTRKNVSLASLFFMHVRFMNELKMKKKREKVVFMNETVRENKLQEKNTKISQWTRKNKRATWRKVSRPGLSMCTQFIGVGWRCKIMNEMKKRS